jgi:thioredoxin-like negative regulator of GroEL
MNAVNSIEEFERIINLNKYVLAYLSNDACNICKVLKPKVEEIVHTMHEVILCYVDTVNFPEISGQLIVFTVPTIILFVEGRENFRFSRNISIIELKEKIERIITLNS